MSDYLLKGEITHKIATNPMYVVSNLGNVYHVLPYYRLKKLKLGRGKRGYLTVTIGRGNTIVVHREVAKAFLPKPMFPNMTVNHKNGIKTDNRAENLEWVTMQENILHSLYVLGKRIQPIMAIDKNGKIVAVAASIKQLSVIGYYPSDVQQVLSGRRRTHLGCTFRRLTIDEYNRYVGEHFCLGHKIMYQHAKG